MSSWKKKFMKQKWFLQKTEFADVDSDEYFETEQLVGTISKIAAMLKKCWGVAGATIISESISSVTVKELGIDGGVDNCFDPRGEGRSEERSDELASDSQSTKLPSFITENLPLGASLVVGFGKSIYAIFAFVEIHEFDRLINCLKEDVINMINDVAVVVHEEVKRWGYVSSGQCNKNLGASFLMVWKIGDQARVMAEYAKASDSLFEKPSKHEGDGRGDDSDDDSEIAGSTGTIGMSMGASRR